MPITIFIFLLLIFLGLTILFALMFYQKLKAPEINHHSHSSIKRFFVNYAQTFYLMLAFIFAMSVLSVIFLYLN